MKKYLLFAVLLPICALLFIQCSESDPVSSETEEDAFDIMNEITHTDSEGNVTGGDTSDWCIPAATSKIEQLPTEYALYPAYPNPNLGASTIAYDLPEEVMVNIFVTDTSGTVIKELVAETQPVGRYTISWDHRDANEAPAPVGLYRINMTAGDFECYGDLASILGKISLNTTTSAGQFTVSYDSDVPVAALWLIMPFDGTYGSIGFGVAARDMQKSISAINDTLKVLLISNINQISSMPAGQHTLLSVGITGNISLDYVDASDTLGIFKMETEINNLK